MIQDTSSNGSHPSSSFEDDGQELETPSRPNEFAKLLAESWRAPRKKLRQGEKITGEVLLIGKEEIFVSLGQNREGILPRIDVENALEKSTGVKGSELPFSVGSKIDVYVARMRGDDTILSLKPHSTSAYGSRGRGREAAEGRSAPQHDWRAFLADHPVGTEVTGEVKRVEAFGAFVELCPGLEGLAHVSELAWSRVGHPSEILEVGQKRAFKIVKIEPQEMGRPRVALSLKQLSAHPWDQAARELTVGSVITGKVTRCEKFGALVEVAPGVEGLIPMSEMSHTKRVVRSDELIHPGETVTVKLKAIDAEQRRMTLSLKDAGEDPWALADTKFAVGKLFRGRVERRESYGVFVKLEDGIVGLLPKAKTLDHPEFHFEKLKVGDEVTVQVAELQREQRRVGLSLPADPDAENWREYTGNAPAAATGGAFGGQLAQQLAKAWKK